jgi:hypothetical protein
MAKPNYQYEKRKRDLERKKKQEEKRQRKLERKHGVPDDNLDQPAPEPENIQKHENDDKDCS